MAGTEADKHARIGAPNGGTLRLRKPEKLK